MFLYFKYINIKGTLFLSLHIYIRQLLIFILKYYYQKFKDKISKLNSF